MAEVRYLISDAARKVDVETHVLRYWEEELDLPIPRNELGHRYYTDYHIRLFRQIKDLKDRGYQLKAIKNALSKMSGMMGDIIITEDYMEEDMRAAWKESRRKAEQAKAGQAQEQSGSINIEKSVSGDMGKREASCAAAGQAASGAGVGKQAASETGQKKQGVSGIDVGKQGGSGTDMGKKGASRASVGTPAASGSEKGKQMAADTSKGGQAGASAGIGVRQPADMETEDSDFYADGAERESAALGQKKTGSESISLEKENQYRTRFEGEEEEFQDLEGQDLEDLQSETQLMRAEKENSPEDVEEISAKMERFQMIMNHVIGQALEANAERLGRKLADEVNEQVSENVTEKVMREVEYLLRISDEKEEERFRQLDETIRAYQKNGKSRAEAAAAKVPFFKKRRFGKSGKKLF